jgi:Protein of unknown function (Hypoth_ymh)
MFYNLTDNQKNLISWIVDTVRNGISLEEFDVHWVDDEAGYILTGYQGDRENVPIFSRWALDSLAVSELILQDIHNQRIENFGEYESFRRCTLRGLAYVAVDTKFSEPDTSFIIHLTPLADVANLDEELKSRCLPILGAGSADPKLWDSSVRTAGVILEERLRTIGEIGDKTRVDRDLVNDVFGTKGTHSRKFSSDSERQGYRDLYSGVVGAFRNPYSHRLIDPAAEDGGAFIVFVNLLIKMLEDFKDNQDTPAT